MWEVPARALGTALAEWSRDPPHSCPDELLLRKSGGDQQERRAEDGEYRRVGVESFHLWTSFGLNNRRHLVDAPSGSGPICLVDDSD